MRVNSSRHSENQQPIVLNELERLSFLSTFRAARHQVLRDAEAADAIIFAVERLGSFLTKQRNGLGRYQSALSQLTQASPFHSALSKTWRTFHTPFNRLYDSLLEARNDAMHQGVAARHLATHAVQLALIIEDALMANGTKISDVMVRNPVCAELWQPVSFIRQVMLTESFSHLPVLWKGEWWLVGDATVASYLRSGGNHANRNERLSTLLKEAMDEKRLIPTRPRIIRPDAGLGQVATDNLSIPALVVDGTEAEEGKLSLLGIVTAYDLL